MVEEIGICSGRLNHYKIQSRYGISIREIEETWTISQVYTTCLYMEIEEDAQALATR